MNRFENVKAAMRRILDHGAPGNSIAIHKGGELLYENYEGLADIDSGRPVTSETLFRIYSMTKVIAVAAALMLFERGEFLLTDPVEEYLPQFKGIKVRDCDWQGNEFLREPKSPLLVKHLFSMTSGIASAGGSSEVGRGYAEGMSKAQKEHGDGYSIAHYTDIIAQSPLAFDPGEHWRYGSSLDVLARMLEVISGKTLGQFLSEEIFVPLGMEDTFFKLPGEKAERLCSMYRVTGEGLKKVTNMDGNYRPGTKIEYASGGLISSLRDYSRFAQALACGHWKGVSILGKRTIALMAQNQLSPQAMKDFEEKMGHYIGYGYGLGVRTMMDTAAAGSNGCAGEFGWYGMAGSWMLVDAENQLSIVYMQQTLPAMEGYAQSRLRNAVYSAI
ncbi:MAG: serine hydrolase domain-containing protein [Christensenellales bacterium]|jgi:CubicO group peptidase (beta-lactamase class C family)